MDSNLTSAVSSTTRNHMFLATAVIRVLNKYGEIIECKALLDPGSQVNLMSDKLCKQLHLQCNDDNLSIKGICNASLLAQKRTTVEISSRVTNFNKLIEVFILDQIVGDQPCQDFPI